MTPIFKLKGIEFRYESGALALAGIDLDVKARERVAVLGANGSGKSTLIRVLDGLAHPTAGEILAFGEPLTEQSLANERFNHTFRRRVGFVFQNADAQLFSPTVRDEIAFGPLQLGLPISDVEQRVDDLAGMLGIGALLERAPFQLSGGEKRKVAIACTLAINPEVILLDEPTTGLDPRSQYWLVELLVQLHQAGKTIVVATHDLNIVPIIADRAVVFSEDHRIVADGPVRSILSDLTLLQRVNLIHPSLHAHDGVFHAHPGAVPEHHHHLPGVQDPHQSGDFAT